MVQTVTGLPIFDHNVALSAEPPILSFLAHGRFILGLGSQRLRRATASISDFYNRLLDHVCVGSRRTRQGVCGLAAATPTSLAFYLGGTVVTDPALMLGIKLANYRFLESSRSSGRQQLGMEILVLRWRIDRHAPRKVQSQFFFLSYLSLCGLRSTANGTIPGAGYHG